jgi:hypothetical protein
MITLNCVASLVSDLFDTPDIHTESLKSMDTAKYFQNGSQRSLKFGTQLEVFKFYHLRFFSIF